MREWFRVLLLFSCYLVLGICPSSAQSVGESGPPTATPTVTPTPTPVPCELYSLRIWEPCERYEPGHSNDAAYCIDYLMSGSQADGKRNASINLATSGTANQESCILQTLINGFKIYDTGDGPGRTKGIDFNAASELSDNSYSFSGSYDYYKYRPDWVARTFWTTIKAKAGLSDAPYQNIRNNYIIYKLQ